MKLSFKKKQEYQELYKTWNPTDFDAEKWMEFFERCGFRCFAITTKHHEGFCMFDTKTRVKKRVNWTAKGGPKLEECDLAYSIMETPFGRDVIRELCDAGRAHNMKIDLYFSHPDWYDADFRPYAYHPVVTWDGIIHPNKYCSQRTAPNRIRIRKEAPTAEETQRFLDRHRQQLVEIISNYGQINMCCLDIRLGPACWPHVRDTMKILRKIQPDVMYRNRGIGNYGDYYTPEGFVPGDPSNTNMPWMVIYPLGKSFSYEGEVEAHKGTKWVIHNLIDTVAKGGNFMVGIGPDGTGWFHPEAIKELEAAGDWIRVNSEGIYETRPWKYWKEGSSLRFVKTKDDKYVFIHTLEWPGSVLQSNLVKPKLDSPIYMLGVEEPLSWKMTEKGLEIQIPENVEANKPCEHAWVFKVELESA